MNSIFLSRDSVPKVFIGGGHVGTLCLGPLGYINITASQRKLSGFQVQWAKPYQKTVGMLLKARFPDTHKESVLQAGLCMVCIVLCHFITSACVTTTTVKIKELTSLQKSLLCYLLIVSHMYPLSSSLSVITNLFSISIIWHRSNYRWRKYPHVLIFHWGSDKLYVYTVRTWTIKYFDLRNHCIF